MGAAQHLITADAALHTSIVRIFVSLDLFGLGPGGADGRGCFDAGAPRDDRAHHQFCRCAVSAVEIIPWHRVRKGALGAGCDFETRDAQGCGPCWWRGPWGHCRDTPYSGRVPGGGWVYDLPPAYGYFGNGCPPGYWHGPWGHCRDTPYHGRLPGGGWQ